MHEFSFPDGTKPDVLMANLEDNFLFCGDAKDADNETVDNMDTVERIGGYFRVYASLLRYEFKGGHLAIATNSKKEAKRWIPKLNVLAKAATIKGENGASPDFKAIEINISQGETTCIVFW